MEYHGPTNCSSGDVSGAVHRWTVHMLADYLGTACRYPKCHSTGLASVPSLRSNSNGMPASGKVHTRIPR